MDEAERFVRDAMSFTGQSSGRPKIFEKAKRIGRWFKRLRKPDEPEDPFSYVGAPLKPRPPLRRSAVRLPRPFSS